MSSFMTVKDVHFSHFPAGSTALFACGRAVQVDSFRSRVESAYGFSARDYNFINCFQICFKFQLAPLQCGICGGGAGGVEMRTLGLSFDSATVTPSSRVGFTGGDFCSMIIRDMDGTLGTGAGGWVHALDLATAGRGLHSSTSQLNVITFGGIRQD